MKHKEELSANDATRGKEMIIVRQYRLIFTTGYVQLIDIINVSYLKLLDGVMMTGEAASIFNNRRFRLPYISYVFRSESIFQRTRTPI